MSISEEDQVLLSEQSDASPASEVSQQIAALANAPPGAVRPSEYAAANGHQVAPPDPLAWEVKPSRLVDAPSERLVEASHDNGTTCACGGDKTCTCGERASVQSAQLVFALGFLGYDFGTEARRDSIAQHMKEPANPFDHAQLLDYLDENPWDAGEIIWTLNLDQMPIYAIATTGSFASQICERLRQCMREQLEEGVECISVPATIVARARLSTGQVVPLILPVLRGMYSWTIKALVDAVVPRPKGTKAEQGGTKRYAVRNFLLRIYHELRNLGMLPQDRAVNYSATNALLVSQIFERAIKDKMELDTIESERSPICRPDSDCWDVKLTFFDPQKIFERARKVFRFTIDVSDVVPVMVGDVRSWSVR